MIFFFLTTGHDVLDLEKSIRLDVSRTKRSSWNAVNPLFDKAVSIPLPTEKTLKNLFIPGKLLISVGGANVETPNLKKSR